MSNKLVRECSKLLKGAGVPFELVQGKKHTEVFIEGQRVTVLSNSPRGRNLHMVEDHLRNRGKR